MKSAKNDVLAQYPNARCVRTTFGLAISDQRPDGSERMLIEVRTAYYEEEVWLACAEECCA